MNTISEEENKPVSNNRAYCTGCNRVVHEGEPTIHSALCQTAEAIEQRNTPRGTVGEMIVELELTAKEQLHKMVKQTGDELIARIKFMPASRENSLAITNIEQGLMWIEKGQTG